MACDELHLNSPAAAIAPTQASTIVVYGSISVKEVFGVFLSVVSTRISVKKVFEKDPNIRLRSCGGTPSPLVRTLAAPKS